MSNILQTHINLTKELYVGYSEIHVIIFIILQNGS